MSRIARSSSVDTAYSSHDGIEEGEGVWDHLDSVEEERQQKPPPQSTDAPQGSTKKERSKKQTKADPVETTNFNELPFPPSAIQDFHELAARQWIYGIIAIGTVVAIGSHFHWNLGYSVGAIAIGAFVTRRFVEDLKRDFSWDVERKRGTAQRNSSSAPLESVEWLNTGVSAVWPILDPELFIAGVDLLEDALKALSPSIVRTVRVSSVEQGTNPFRILGMRQLPDDTDVAAPPDPSKKPTKKGKKSSAKDSAVPLESPSESGDSTPVPVSSADPVPPPDLSAEEPGTYVNIEVEFAYRRLPPPADKSANAHFLLYLGIGVKKLMKFELPVWVELSGLHGRIRLRLQMIPEPPFVRHVKFSFPQLPAMEVIAKPLRTFNIMTLPGISPFILSSINSVLSNFTAPKSYTIDLSRFFLGSDVAMKTDTLGVVCLIIHRAEGLASADVDGTSDPFCNVSFSQIGRVLYTTRILRNSLKPVWEEVAFLRITSEHIEDGDKIRLTVLDHDRYSHDDVLGFIDIPFTGLYQKPGQYDHSTKELRSSHRGTRAQGHLSYSAAFFALAKSTPPLSDTEDVDGVQNERPASKGAKHKPMFTDRSQAEDSRSGAYAQRMREMLDGRLPANTSQRSGICAFQVHQISQLDCPRGKHAHDHVHHKEGHLPSSYCTVFFNDEKVFQTRTKPFSAAPYFNATSELFCRDWTRSRIDFVVMDSRDRDHDVVIGMVSLKVRDLFSNRSQNTQWFPLLGGSGHGRIRLSLLFKPVDIEIHPCLRDWSVGVLEISKARAFDLKDQFSGRLVMTVDQGSPHHSSDTESHEQKNGLHELVWPLYKPIRIPVLARHCAGLFVRVQAVHALTRKSTAAEANLWLSAISDGEMESQLLPLFQSVTPENSSRPTGTIPLPRIPQNLVRPTKGMKADRDSHTEIEVQRDISEPKSTRTPAAATAGAADAPSATLQLGVRWLPGIHEEHREIVLESSAAVREAYQVWLHREDRATEHDKKVVVVKAEEGHDEHERERHQVAVSPKSSAAQSQASSRRNSFAAGGSEGGVEGGNGRGRMEGDGWSTDEDSKKVKPKKKGMKTVGWIGHGIKLASKKVKASTKHKVKGPAAETEVYSSL